MKNSFLRKTWCVYLYRATCERNISSRMTQHMSRCRRYVSYRYSLNLKLFVDTAELNIFFFE